MHWYVELEPSLMASLKSSDITKEPAPPSIFVSSPEITIPAADDVVPFVITSCIA